ncbi:MAG TPA: hypothetical protein VK196_20105 [Magnetospirillum sp.]|nr:hypothetical protein [Magnetospirillum sp.]
MTLPSLRAGIASLALVAVVVLSIGRAVFAWPPAGPAAAAALALYLLLEGWSARRGGRRIMVMALTAAAAAIAFHPQPWPLLLTAGIQSAALIGLFTALGFLREAAENSPMIQACGQLMVRQPPGRRYLALAMGSHLIGLVLNFGVLPLIGTMVVKGNTAEAAGGDPRIVEIRQRRMMTAIIRGFAIMTVWSPLSISFAVMQSAIPGLNWWPLLAFQLTFTALLMGLGWLMDRLAFPPLPSPSPSSDWRPVIQLLGLVAGVVVASVALAEMLSVRLVVGAMVVVPPAAVLWLMVQHRTVGPALLHLGRRLTVSMPGFREEVTMLGGAMFLGTVVVAFIPAGETARLIGLIPLPPALVLVLATWSVMALSQVGISQIVSVTVLGGALASLSSHGLPPLAVASGLMGAWALSACSTPVGAVVLSVARLAGVPMRTVARQWNGRFVLLGALLLAAWVVMMCAIVDVSPPLV